MNKRGQMEGWIALGVIVAIIILVASLMAIIPRYNVWSKELGGKAELKEAEWSRQIAVEEAKAEKESAQLKADADVIRATGIAEANEIIADSLTPEYIKWKWVEGLHDGSSEIIYVATEAGIPIMEANRLA